jgi:hypothetical protein
MLMDAELRAALRSFAATVNHLASTGGLPTELAGPAYQLLVAAQLPPNERPAVSR